MFVETFRHVINCFRELDDFEFYIVNPELRNHEYVIIDGKYIISVYHKWSENGQKTPDLLFVNEVLAESKNDSSFVLIRSIKKELSSLRKPSNKRATRITFGEMAVQTNEIYSELVKEIEYKKEELDRYDDQITKLLGGNSNDTRQRDRLKSYSNSLRDVQEEKQDLEIRLLDIEKKLNLIKKLDHKIQDADLSEVKKRLEKGYESENIFRLPGDLAKLRAANHPIRILKLNGKEYQTLDFSYLKFMGLTLENKRFSGCNFDYAKFLNCRLSDVEIYGSIVQSFRFASKPGTQSITNENSVWKDCTFKKMVFKNCDFSFLNIQNTAFIDCQFINCTFYRSKWNHVNCNQNNFYQSDFEGTEFLDVNFKRAKLNKTNFSKATCNNVDFQWADLNRIDWQEFSYSGTTVFIYAHLSKWVHPISPFETIDDFNNGLEGGAIFRDKKSYLDGLNHGSFGENRAN